MAKVLAAVWLALLVFGLNCCPDTGTANAAEMRIVALGTSNTYGKGVARNQTYPAQLQSLLTARGINARISNAGVNGDSSAGMLARLASAVPNGTRLVLLEIHQGNEARRGVSGQTSENTSAIISRLQARGIRTLDISGTMASYLMGRRDPALRQPDGHLTGQGYTDVANALVSQVASALGN